jgi:hypothetical protein
LKRGIWPAPVIEADPYNIKRLRNQQVIFLMERALSSTGLSNEFLCFNDVTLARIQMSYEVAGVRCGVP